MSVVLGSGEHRYRAVENWAGLPDGWEFRDVAAVAVDSKDRVYVFNRGQHPMIVLDRDGSSGIPIDRECGPMEGVREGIVRSSRWSSAPCRQW